MGLPIISDVFSLVNSAIDKIWPDADTKVQAKERAQSLILAKAMEDKKLLFQDTESARQVYIEELKTANTPKWARSIQVLGRQFALYATVALYVWSKVSSTFGLPEIPLTERDYYLIGVVFVFLFGARTVEKIRGVDKN